MIQNSSRQVLTEWFQQPEKQYVQSPRLIFILTSLLDSTGLEDKVDAWIDLADWYRHGTKKVEKNRYSHDHSPNEVVLDLLENSPIIQTRFHDALRFMLDHTDAISLFAKAGIPSGRGFLSEVLERTMTRLLPSPRNDHELSKVLWRQFHHDSHIDRFRDIPPALFHRMVGTMFPTSASEPMLGNLKLAYADSFRLLSIHIQGEGFSEQLRVRSPQTSVESSPFYQLTLVSDAVMDTWIARENVYAAVLKWREVAKSCREVCRQIGICLEEDGVNLDIVTGLEIIDRALSRMEHMIDVLCQPEGFSQSAAVHRLLAELLTGIHHDRSLWYYLDSSTNLLHRKIVDRAGQTGEHYLAHTRKEYGHILIAAAGGGLLTTFTAAIKLKLYAWQAAPFLIGVASSVNYATSFLLMQLFGLVLATKQPAMTAAYLASIIREKQGQERLKEISYFTSSIVRAQLAAALANVTVVSIGAYALDFIWEVTRHHDVLAPEQAEHVFKNLSPLDSGTFFYAALTGVLLWMGSLAGGWFENLMVYYRTADGIRDHPLRKLLGRERMARWAERFRQNISGVATNIALGFLLGMTPVIGLFLGAPLDVRHVTLSSGQLALASASLNADWWHHGMFLRAFLGIATMFVLNLGVSFSLSLITASRAYQLSLREIFHVVTYVFQDFGRRPKEFLLPPKK